MAFGIVQASLQDISGGQLNFPVNMEASFEQLQLNKLEKLWEYGISTCKDFISECQHRIIQK